MRKENSSFNMYFLSQPGVQILHNNDYYGCSELDNFACYVVADGLQNGNNKQPDPSARQAVEAVISAFNENPSISKRAIKKYIKAAHLTLSKGGTASIIIVVTNYESLRYGYAGSCRFNLFRSGKLIQESKDHSLANKIIKESSMPKDKIASHEERNNLTMYCGITTAGFKPTISKKIKLRETDVFAIFTRGIWENAHTDDIMAAIQAGENSPEETAYNLERLILDKATNNDIVDNYTVCLVFVDKLYIDPNEGKRRKKIIIISIIVFVIIAIIAALIIIFTIRRNRMREDMHIAFHTGIEFIQANNFIRALEELQNAHSLAERLRDNRLRMEIASHRMLAETVIHAESLLNSGSYEQAVEAFNSALDRSRYVYNLAILHIEARRERATGYMNVHEFIFLGDALVDIGDFDNAESQYLTARNLAARIFYTEGRRLAVEALESLYRLREQEIEKQNEEIQSEAIAQVTAAELIVQGDNAFRNGDFIAARLFYQLARERFSQMGSDEIVATIDDRLALTDQREEQNEQNLELAENFIILGDGFMEQGNFNEARRFFLMARDIYMSQEEENELLDVLLRLDIVEILIIGEATAAKELQESDNEIETNEQIESNEYDIEPTPEPDEEDEYNEIFQYIKGIYV